jgi:hypothetical protein
MSDKKKFYVSRWVSYKQHATVEATSEEDAMRIADGAGAEVWKGYDKMEVGEYDTVQEVAE